MARLFVRTSQEYLQVESPVVTSYPIGMACWFKSTNVTNRQSLIFVGDKDTTSYYIALQLEPGYVSVLSKNYGVAEFRATTTLAFSTGVWQHAAGLFLGVTERHAYLNAGSKGSSTGEVGAMSTHDRTSIGASRDSSDGDYADAEIAEAAIWDLTAWGANDAERETSFEKVIASLAKGFAPSFFPLGLKAYWPLIRTLNDKVGGFNLTASGTVISPGTRIIVPSYINTGRTHLRLGTASGSTEFTGTATAKALKTFTASGSIEFTASVVGKVLKTFTAGGSIEFTGTVTGAIGHDYMTPAMHASIVDPQQGGAWLWFIVVKLPGYNPIKYVRNTEDVNYCGIPYTAYNFQNTNPKQGSEGSVSRTTVKIAQDADYTLEDKINALHGKGGWIKIIKAHVDHLDEFILENETVSYILSMKSNTDWVTFTLGDVNPSKQVFPIRRCSSQICPFHVVGLFKGIECGYAGADKTCTGLYSDCDDKGNAVRWGGELMLERKL